MLDTNYLPVLWHSGKLPEQCTISVHESKWFTEYNFKFMSLNGSDITR